MCGFVGFANLKHITTDKDFDILKNMTSAITHRGPDEGMFFSDEHVNLGHRRLVILDAENGKQPMSFTYDDVTYSMVYNGQLYNSKDIRMDLISLGYTFCGYSDTEVVLKAFIHYGTDIFKSFNGIFSFAIWNNKKQELTLCRDQFGIKPLYYTLIDDTIVFSSEIKAILKYPSVTPIVDKQGICELFGIGPSHTPGTSIFKNIFEIEPAHYAVFNNYGFNKT